MTSVVLDASALIAYLRRERGADVVEKRLAGAAVLSVNYSEVLKKGIESGATLQDTCEAVDFLQLTVFDFDVEMAKVSASFWPATKPLGLSMADRACLALAKSLGRPAVIAESKWKKLDIGVPVVLIR